MKKRIMIKMAILGISLFFVSYFGLNAYSQFFLSADTDTSAPMIVRVDANSGYYDVDDTVWTLFYYSKQVKTAGDVLVRFNSGGSCTMNFSSLANSSYCYYKVKAGENNSILDISSITGSIIDGSGQAMTNFTPGENFAHRNSISVNTNAPIIDKISATPGNYKVGSNLAVSFYFSKPVNSTGSIQVNFNNSSNCNLTLINSLSSWCSLAIVRGQDINLLDISSITGIIKDKYGRLMVNKVPTIGLGSSNVVIDTVSPLVSAVTTDFTGQYLKVGDSVTIRITMSEPVFGSGTVYLNTGNSCYFNNYKLNTWIGDYTCTVKMTQTSKEVNKLNVDHVALNFYDKAQNTASNTITSNIQDVKTIIVDVTYPAISIVSAPGSLQKYTYSDRNYFSDGTYENSYNIAGAITDGQSGIKAVRLDGQALGPAGSFNVNFDTSRYGYYDKKMEIEDVAGNVAMAGFSISRGHGDVGCNYTTTMWKGPSISKISVPIWKYVGKKKKVKVTQVQTLTKRVRTYKYDRKKRKAIRGWKTVTYKKKVTKWVWQYATKTAKDIKSSSMTLRVNSNCVNEVKNIFNRIYNSPDRPAINPGETACYRKNNPCSACRHDYGVACDINVSQNAAFRYTKGVYKPYAGSYWKPGPQYVGNPGWTSGWDPLSIPTDGSIARAFRDENWGGQLIGDYMHFSLDGS